MGWRMFPAYCWNQTSRMGRLSPRYYVVRTFLLDRGPYASTSKKLKAQALIQDLERIPKNNRLPPTEASKLRGRLGFSRSLLVARVGHALLQPITRWRYTHFRKKPQLGDDLRYCTNRRIASIKHPTPGMHRANPPLQLRYTAMPMGWPFGCVRSD